MATKKNIAVVIGTIKTIYPYYAKDTNVEMLVKTWLAVLNGYEDTAINNALLLCLKECEMPPTPTDIVKKIEILQNNDSLTELWAKYTVVLQKINDLQYDFKFTKTETNGKTQGQNAKEKAKSLYDELPEQIKNYFGSFGECLRMARTFDETNLNFEKNRFFKTMPDICSQVCDRKYLIEHNIKKQIQENY